MNPFKYGTIVRGGDFFDRKEECSRIVETLMGGNNMVLYAPRRFGKTSLVFKVIEQLEKKKVTCVYFDFMTVYSPESFVRLYAKALSAKQTNMDKFVKIFASAIKNIRPVLGFNAEGEAEFSVDFANTVIDDTIVAQLLDMPETLGSQKNRVVVFFDEFQEAGKLQNINFENLLRSKIQQQVNTSYLFLGSKTHILEEMFNNKKRAFYHSASQISIGPLPEDDTIKYLQNKFTASGITLDTNIGQYLISAAGNIPHYIQLLAAEVWQCLIDTKKPVTKKIVDYCVTQILALKGDYYLELFDRQSQGRKQLLQSLTVSGKNVFSAAYINTYGLNSVSTVQRSMKDLVEEGIVEKLKGEYVIADPFFKAFVAGIMRGVTS
ncbi:ATP-binding protein [Treponema primitia]|uniref:AAA family ATPase n=1 Tax=Treponema primitia TaxID=88058 RepID=UPI0039800A44